MEENLFNALTVSATFSSSSYIASDGYNVYVTLSGVSSLPLLPSTAIDGFYLTVNGIPISIKSASVQNPSGSSTQKSTVVLKTYVKIKSTDTVQVKYYDGNLTDNSTDVISDIAFFTITDNRSTENKYFDASDWNLGLNSGEVVIGSDSGFFTDATDLFKKEYTYPFAEVILDTKPPEGVVIINESATTGGIDVRTFAAYAPLDASASGYSDRSLSLTTATIEGWQFVSSTEQRITSFIIELKSVQLSAPTPAIGNQTGRVTVSLYSNTTGDIPNTQIVELGVIQYDTLTTSYQEFSLTPLVPVTLSAQTTYWIVLSFETIIKSGVTSSGAISLMVKNDSVLSYAVYESNAWRRLAQKQIGFLKLVGTVSDGTPISADIMAQDIIGKNLYQATNFGGSTNTSQYEKIGAGDAYFLNMYLTPDSTTGLYPLVQAVNIGATASKTKSYVVETKLTPKSSWETLYFNSASTTTTDFIRYKFNTPTRFSNIRIGYRGDLLANIEAGTLTIAGIDEWSDVVEVQASHFSDFRDADEFENVNTRAWAPFTEGASVYNWNITNQSKLWEKLDNYSSVGFLKSVPISNQMVLASYQKISVAQGSAQRSALNLDLTVQGDTINAITVHNSVVYIGTELGYVYQSSQGDYWTIVNQKNPLDSTEYKTLPPVTALASHGGALYVGTKKTTTKSASVYKYFDKKFTAIKTDFTENKISAFASNLGILFVGTAGKFGTLQGTVYRYNGTDFKKISPEVSIDEVQAMIYSTALSTVVAGFSGGQVYKLIYDSNNNPSTWSLLEDIDATNIYNLNDDTSGKYLFVSTDTKLLCYVKSLDVFKTLSYPKYSNPGLQITWKQFAAVSTDYKNDRDFSFTTIQNQSSSISEFNLNSSKPTGIGVSYYTAVFEGAIRPDTSASYQFLIDTNTSVRLTVNGTVLTAASLWTTESNVTTNTLTDNPATQTVSLVADNYYSLKLEVAVKETGAFIPKISLKWKDTSSVFNDFSPVDSSYFFKPNVITSINNLVNSYLGSGMDGSSYNFDPSFYETTKRYAYVRLKDEAGNYHNYRLADGTVPYESLNDFIYQGDTGGGDPIPGIGYISFAPTSVLAGSTAIATLRIPNSVNSTSVYTITTDGNSTSSVSSLTVPANSLSATFNVTVNSTVASTVTSTIVTATLGDASYTGSLGVTPGTGGGGDGGDGGVPGPGGDGGDSNTTLKGVIYQIKPEMNPAIAPITYIPSVTDAIYSPKRKVRSTGSYVNQPFYVPTLSQWTTLSVLILNEYHANIATGLDAGTAVNVYVRTSDTSAGCFETPWSEAYSKSYINNSSVPLTAETLTIDLQAYSGKFIQYYIELVSATQGDTPEVKAVTITYKAATGSYFFTKTFDTEDYSTTIPVPTFRRGLLTSNQDKKDGEIVYGYTTDDRDGYKYDFGRYTIIEPNKTFELDTPSSTIKFAILLTSIDGDPSIVYDFAVQLDAGDEDMKFMPEL
jgi:hypothetical protein